MQWICTSKALQYRDGKLAVVGSIIYDDKSQTEILFPEGYAHTLGCFLIEMSQIAREMEATLKTPPNDVLDVTTLPSFSQRIEKRMRENGSTATVTFR